MLILIGKIIPCTERPALFTGGYVQGGVTKTFTYSFCGTQFIHHQRIIKVLKEQ